MSVPCRLPRALLLPPWDTLRLQPQGIPVQLSAPAAHRRSTKVGGLLGRGCERVGLWAQCPLMGNSNTSPRGRNAENICSERVTISHPPDQAGPRGQGLTQSCHQETLKKEEKAQPLQAGPQLLPFRPQSPNHTHWDGVSASKLHSALGWPCPIGKFSSGPSGPPSGRSPPAGTCKEKRSGLPSLSYQGTLGSPSSLLPLLWVRGGQCTCPLPGRKTLFSPAPLAQGPQGWKGHLGVTSDQGCLRLLQAALLTLGGQPGRRLVHSTLLL